MICASVSPCVFTTTSFSIRQPLVTKTVRGTWVAEMLQLQKSLETAQEPDGMVKPSKRGRETARHTHKSTQFNKANTSKHTYHRCFAAYYFA